MESRVTAVGCTEVFVALATQRVAAIAAFYQTLFNQAPQPYCPPQYAEFSLPGLKLAIFQPRDDQSLAFAAPAAGRVSLCLEVQNLPAAIAFLRGQGYPVAGKQMQTSHGQEIYLYDPDGNRLILHQGHPGQAPKTESAAAAGSALPGESPTPPEY